MVNFLVIKKFISLRKLPRSLVKNSINSLAYHLIPLIERKRGTKELGPPFDIFSIAGIINSNKTSSLE